MIYNLLNEHPNSGIIHKLVKSIKYPVQDNDDDSFLFPVSHLEWIKGWVLFLGGGCRSVGTSYIQTSTLNFYQ